MFPFLMIRLAKVLITVVVVVIRITIIVWRINCIIQTNTAAACTRNHTNNWLTINNLTLIKCCYIDCLIKCSSAYDWYVFFLFTCRLFSPANIQRRFDIAKTSRRCSDVETTFLSATSWLLYNNSSSSSSSSSGNDNKDYNNIKNKPYYSNE